MTGGSSGIGAAVVRRLRAGGADVLAIARGADRLDALAADTGARVFAADVSDELGLREVVAEAEDAWDGATPDAVVHSAGHFSLAPVAETSLLDFDRALDVNLRAAFMLIRAFLPAMLERGSGDVVSIGSVAGRVALPGNAAYSASKYGLRGLHEVLGVELRGTGVRATLVEPAATRTAAWDDVVAPDGVELPPRDAMLAADAVADVVVYAITREPGVRIPILPIERG